MLLSKDEICSMPEREQFFVLLLFELMDTYNIPAEDAKKLIKESKLPEWTLSADMKEYVYHYDVADWAHRLVADQKQGQHAVG